MESIAAQVNTSTLSEWRKVIRVSDIPHYLSLVNNERRND
jgi:hypothetical protein